MIYIFVSKLAKVLLYDKQFTNLKKDLLKQGIWETTPDQIRLTPWVKGGSYRRYDIYRRDKGRQMMLNYRAVGSSQSHISPIKGKSRCS